MGALWEFGLVESSDFRLYSIHCRLVGIAHASSFGAGPAQELVASPVN